MKNVNLEHIKHALEHASTYIFCALAIWFGWRATLKTLRKVGFTGLISFRYLFLLLVLFVSVVLTRFLIDEESLSLPSGWRLPVIAIARWFPAFALFFVFGYWITIRKPRSSSFYQSREWHTIRNQVLDHYGRKCMKCGAREEAMHVDHIKPRSKHPKLELKFENLQVLCRSCNMAKSNRHETDYRFRFRLW